MLADRLRSAVAASPKLRRVPLRTKLVAAVLVLVLAALALISAASTYALHTSLVHRVDKQITTLALGFQKSPPNTRVFMPNDFFLTQTAITGAGGQPYYDYYDMTADDVPKPLGGVKQVTGHLNVPFTVSSPNGNQWRMLIIMLNDDSVLQVAQWLDPVNDQVAHLIWIDLLVGTGVLLVLAAVGAAMVRQSLVPLLQIESTAGAIAAGDLTRRVPDPEPRDGEPRTELGRLSRALNTMLAQIEAAFTARALSETAARAAESSARDAAEAAKLSEARAVRSEGKMRQFVADASHELRTPLTTIRGFAELYRQGAVQNPEDVARLVRRIEDEANRMGLLVEDLLLLARLDRERPITLAPVELPVLAIDAVQAAQAVAPERSIKLDIQDKSEDLVAYGDDARLRQVIGNLMTNALVHTPPEASVTLRLYAESGNRAVVEIADTGPGLSESQRDHVFERFYRADEARTRHTDREATGTGLGLAIVAAIVRAHNGTVEVISEPGQGATFRVTLPALPFTENIQA
jgi:two-component system OmpR family sensor kinase